MTLHEVSGYASQMGTLAEKKERFRSQIHELNRLADEAEACAQLLRQQADQYQEILDQEDLSEEKLDSLLAEPTTKPDYPTGAFRLTEGLM